MNERSYPWGEPRDDDPPRDPIGDWLRRGYRLHVRWRSHEQRFHAYVDMGDIASSQNFMAESLDEALAGLERYLESHASSQAKPGDKHE